MYQQEPNPIAGSIALTPWLLVIGSAVGVYIDAKSIGARKGLIPGFLDLGPLGWSLSTLFLWILAFPLYLATRGRIRQAAAERANPRRYGHSSRPMGWAEAAWQAQGRPQQPAGLLPPPGWYDDPQHPGYSRWWDGVRWTEHRAPKPR